MTTLGHEVVIVTGGAGGIGQAICVELSGQGAAVAVADLDPERAEAVAASLRERYGGRAIGVGVDIRDGEAVDAAVAQVEAVLGGVTGLVNNAAVDVIGPFVESTPSVWQTVIDVNLTGTLRFTHAVLDGMISRRAGRIVMISSEAGRVGNVGEVVYSATKGGMTSFAKSLAREMARHQITVNVVCPGPIRSALLEQFADADRARFDRLQSSIPLRRIGEPSDVSPAVAFLLSPGAAYITGQTLSVSGGLTMT